ncbi:hypothetical protein DV737_g3704, partial [Chaetothyriales sp. CBS 132003]
MAAVCIAAPVAGRDEDVYGLQKIQNPALDDPDFLPFLSNPSPAFPSVRRADWRSPSPLHTALLTTGSQDRPPSQRCKTSISTHLFPNNHNAYLRASVLVADLLAQIAAVKQGPSPNIVPVPEDDHTAVTEPDGHQSEDATARVSYDSSAPAPVPRSSPTAAMDFDFDFADPAHVQTRGKKKKAKATQQVNCWADDVINNANGEDEWATGFTSKKEKKKKGKKAAEDPPLSAPDPPGFQDINLDDTAPKLDFSFGGSDKKDAGGFDKKKAVDEKEDDKFNLDSKDDDLWSPPTSKKDKKKGKKLAAEDPLPPPPPAPTVPVPPPPADDSWSSFGFGKKEKKKTAKKAAETTAPAESEAAAETSFDWGIGTSKKDKTTKSKSLIAELDEPLAAADPPAATDSFGDDDWMGGAWGKKSTTKKEKKIVDDLSASTKLDKTQAEKTKADQDDDTWAAFPTTTSKKDKKAKKGFFEEEQPLPPPPDPEPLAADDVFPSSGTKSKAKDKKGKKLKDADPEPLTQNLDPDLDAGKEDPVDDIWGFVLAEANPLDEFDGVGWGLSTKDKKKKEKDAKKKSLIDPVVEANPDVLQEDNPKTKAATDDVWAAFDTKPTKKGKKNKVEDDPLPLAPTPPAQGLTPEAKTLDFLDDDLVDDTWAGLDATKSKAPTKKGTLSKTSTKDSTKSKEKEKDPEPKAIESETPAKATKSIWGFGSAATGKTLTKKEKDAKAKKEAEEQAAKEEEERLAREAEEQAAKEEEERLAREAEEKAAQEAEEKAAREAEEKAAQEAKEKAAKEAEEKSVKKTKGKLGKTASKTTTDTKKKAAAEDPPVDILSPASAKDAKTPTSGKLSKTSLKMEEKAAEKEDDYFGFGWGAASTSKKTAGKKDAESKKEIKGKDVANEDDALLDLTNDLDGGFSLGDEPASSSKKAMKADKKAVVASSEKKEKATVSKTKTATAKESKTASKKKDLVSPVEEVKSRDSVPGSFPDAFEDDMLGASASPEKAKAKTSKPAEAKAGKAKATTIAKKASKPAADLLMDEAPEPPKLPTPPPEEKKAAKKERPRVERSGTSSWGFWGVAPAPKKSTKEKVVNSSPPPPPSEKKERSPPALVRSKSTKTSKDKEREKEDKQEADKASKSSSSEKEAKPKKAERPSKATRGTGFSNFMFGGPPPSAMKKSASTRRSSTAGGSRSSSRSRVAGAPPSPPPDSEVEMNDKAAKLLGTKPTGKITRKASVKATKSKVPDPYPIDSDDMVMINAPEDTPPKESKPKAKTKVSSSQAKASKSKDKEVRTATSSRRDSVSRPSWSPDFTKEVQANGRVSYKQLPKRSNTMSQDEDVVMVDANDKADPLVTSGPDDMAFVDHPPAPKRTNTTSRRTSTGFFGSLFGTAAPRVEESRPRSQTLTTDDQDHGVPIRTKSSSRRKSKVVDADEFTTDAPAETDAERAERRTKREAREDAERADREARRRERREREKGDLEARRSRAREKERKEREAEEARRDERRARQEYHSSRDGAKKGHLSHVPDTGKTNSWVNSQAEDPPDLPPVEETILDPAGELPRRAGEGRSERRRADKYAGMTDAEIEQVRRERRKSRREKIEKSVGSGGSGGGRRAADYDDYPFDPRAELKRGDSRRRSLLGALF